MRVLMARQRESAPQILGEILGFSHNFRNLLIHVLLVLLPLWGDLLLLLFGREELFLGLLDGLLWLCLFGASKILIVELRIENESRQVNASGCGNHVRWVHPL